MHVNTRHGHIGSVAPVLWTNNVTLDANVRHWNQWISYVNCPPKYPLCLQWFVPDTSSSFSVMTGSRIDDKPWKNCLLHIINVLQTVVIGYIIHTVLAHSTAVSRDIALFNISVQISFTNNLWLHLCSFVSNRRCTRDLT